MHDLELKMEEVKKSFDGMSASIDKALNKKRTVWWAIFMRIASLALFIGCIYAGVMGFGGSSLVLGFMFLSFWFIDRLSVAVIGGFNGWAKGKTAELEMKQK